jgi:16S rRNA (guanine(966)-N(2))-methyltransferase RsmD
VKILTGTLRGETISFSPNPHLRPTADKVRKAIFDILQGGVEGKNALDLFAGTGAMGLEALSNGAERVVFVEADTSQCRKIKDNLTRLKLGERAVVSNEPVEKVLSYFSGKSEYFDLIFLDPPYEKALGEKTLRQIADSHVLHEDTLVILECRKTEPIPGVVGDLKALKIKTYGDTKTLFYGLQNKPNKQI